MKLGRAFCNLVICGLGFIVMMGCASHPTIAGSNSSRVVASMSPDQESYFKFRDSCFSSREAILAGKDVQLREVAPDCSQAVAAGCALYYAQNANHIKAADATNAANMCALVSGYKTMETFGFIGQYDDQCKRSYKEAQSNGKAADWNNNRCFPDDLLSCLPNTPNSKIPAKYRKDYSVCSVMTQAKRLDFVQAFIDNSENLP